MNNKKVWLFNPGSQLAIENGCKCPRMDNNNGYGLGNGLFWISENCELHRTKKESYKE